MTRVNADLHPKSLLDQHLFAEYREIPMVYASLKRSMNAKSMNELLRSIPPKFVLAAGHVTHFYDKLQFLVDRRLRLFDELVIRGYVIENPTNPDISGFPEDLRNNWTMKIDDAKVIRDRIVERYDKQPTWYRYYGKQIERPTYLDIMKQYNGV